MRPIGIKQADKSRTGAAFLLLVIAVLLVVTGATFQLVQSEWMIRGGQGQQRRVETMRRAVEAVEDAAAVTDATDSQDAIRLPIGDNQWIEVKKVSTNGNPSWVADWVRNGNVIDTFEKQIEKQNNDE